MTDGDSEETTDSAETEGDSSPSYGLTGANLMDAIRTHVEDHPFLSQVGITPESFEDGVLRATVPYDEQFANPMPQNPLNGGFLLTVLDTVMGFAIQAATFDDGTATSGPTMNLNTNFLSGATGDLVAEGEIVRLGGSSVVIDGRIRDAESGELVATAQGTWRLYRSD